MQGVVFNALHRVSRPLRGKLDTGGRDGLRSVPLLPLRLSPRCPLPAFGREYRGSVAVARRSPKSCRAGSTPALGAIFRIMKKPPTKDEKDYLGRVARLGCIVCGAPACVHHIRAGMGMGMRASHYDTIPLCWDHHQGPHGIHTLGTKVWQKIYGYERELVERVKKLLTKNSD